MGLKEGKFVEGFDPDNKFTTHAVSGVFFIVHQN
jgi:hypothetical protein